MFRRKTHHKRYSKKFRRHAKKYGKRARRVKRSKPSGFFRSKVKKVVTAMAEQKEVITYNAGTIFYLRWSDLT